MSALDYIASVTATEDTYFARFQHFVDVLSTAGFAGSVTNKDNTKTEATWIYSAPKSTHPTEAVRIVASVNAALQALSFSLSIFGERIIDTDKGGEFISKLGNMYEYLAKGIVALLDSDVDLAATIFKHAHLRQDQILSIVRRSYSPAQKQGMQEFLRDLSKAAKKHAGAA